jgi:hypothetical protein
VSVVWETYTEKGTAEPKKPDGFGTVVARFGANEEFAERYLLKEESIGGAKKHAKCRGLFQELLEAFWAMAL